MPVHIPTEAEKENPKLYANNVRIEISRVLHVPITDHSFEDVILQMTAERLKLPSSDAVIEFRTMSKTLDVTVDSVSEQLKIFAEQDKEHKGMVSMESNLLFF